jgi:hypothetical protein
MTRRPVWLLLLPLCLLLAGCAATEEPSGPTSPATAPFQGPAGPATPPQTSTPPPGVTTPLLNTCSGSDTERDRCKGTTWQTCDLSIHLWKDFALCDSIGQVCSTAPKDCVGLVNTACCTATTTTTPTTTPPTGSACTPCPSGCTASQCKVCTTGHACGNTCIAATETCHAPAGCACNR